MKDTTKKETIKTILETLIKGYGEDDKHQLRQNRYQRQDIDKAIQKTLMLVDERSISKWFKLIWNLHYIIQPEQGFYAINLNKIAELELTVSIPRVVSKDQTRLGRFC